MKQNVDSTGVQYNAGVIVKLKKLYNNIRKQYELTLFRAFLMIDKNGRSAGGDKVTAKSQSISQKSQSGRYVDRHVEQSVTKEVVIESSADKHKYESVINNSKKASLSIMERVFKKNISKQVKKWQYNAIPERRLENIHKEISKTQDNYNFVAKYGALESVAKISTGSSYKSKAKAFRSLLQNMYSKKTDTVYDASLEERLDLINRLNAQM